MISKQQNGVEINTDGIVIDFSKMSDVEIDIMCRSLRDSINRLLSEPDERKAFEQWKRDRELLKKETAPEQKDKSLRKVV